ncbi:MAG: autotransporter assembly complex family protein [Porticoccaceae bacterium]
MPTQQRQTTIFPLIRVRHRYWWTLALLLCCCGAVAQPQSLHPKVTIDNAPEAVVENIRQHLSLDEQRCTVGERRRQALLESADNKIRTALQALGYYQTSWQKELTSEEKCWGLKLHITLGPPVILEQVRVELLGEAAEDSSFKELVARLAPASGEQLHHGKYEELKTALQQLARQRGYAEAHFTQQQLLVHSGENRADILLGFDSGPRYRFGPVNFEQDLLEQSFLQRFVPFSTGEPFNAIQLGKFQQALINSRYFDQVNVTPAPPNAATRAIPVQVVLTPGPRYSTSVGVGAATDTGPRGTLGFRNNRANQEGHRYGADAQLSRVASFVNLNYQIPLDQPASELLTFKGGWEEEDTESAESETWFTGLFHTTTQANDWLRSLELVYQVESFQVADDDHNTRLLIPGIGWQRTQVDNPIFPNRGWRMKFSVRGAAESALSDISFLQVRAAGKGILPLSGGRLLGRVEAGASTVNRFEDMPASLRFFAGGDNSVRGYDYEELGPLNDVGEVVGGRHLLTTSVEYDYPVYKDYSLALFYDAGNAFDNSHFTLKKSFGFGVRWQSPLGPIRVDLAFPEESDESFRLHLSMGPDL